MGTQKFSYTVAKPYKIFATLKVNLFFIFLWSLHFYLYSKYNLRILGYNTFPLYILFLPLYLYENYFFLQLKESQLTNGFYELTLILFFLGGIFSFMNPTIAFSEGVLLTLLTLNMPLEKHFIFKSIVFILLVLSIKLPVLFFINYLIILISERLIQKKK